MKKILIASLTLLTALIMIGCGGEEPQKPAEPNQVKQVNADAPVEQPTSKPLAEPQTTVEVPNPTATKRPTRVPPRLQSKELRLFPPTEIPQPEETMPTPQPTAVALVAPKEPNPTATAAPERVRVRIRAWVFDDPRAGEDMKASGSWETTDPNAVWKAHNTEDDGGSMHLKGYFYPKWEEYGKMEETVREDWKQTTQAAPEFIVGESKRYPFPFATVAFSNKEDTMMRFSMEGSPLDWPHVLVFTFAKRILGQEAEPHEYFGLGDTSQTTEKGRFALHTFALLDEGYENFKPEGKKPSEGPTFSHDDTTVALFTDQSNIIETALIDLPSGDYFGQVTYNEEKRGPSLNLAFNLEPDGEPGLWWKTYEDIHRRNPYVDAKTYHYPQHFIFLSWIVEDEEYGN